MDDPYPTSRDVALRFLRLAGRATLAAAVVLLFYATISLWLSRTPPDEFIRLTVLNIPFSVAGSVAFGALLAGLVMFRYRDAALNPVTLRRAIAVTAMVGTGAAVPVLYVYGWLFPGFDRANLTVVTKGTRAPPQFPAFDSLPSVAWDVGPEYGPWWARRGRQLGGSDPFVSMVFGDWPASVLHEMWAASLRLPSVNELVVQCLADQRSSVERARPWERSWYMARCRIHPLGNTAPQTFGGLSIGVTDYSRLVWRHQNEEVRKQRPKDPAGWDAVRETVRQRVYDEWVARHGKPFRFADFEPQIRDMVSQYHIAARYNPWRLTADALLPLVLGPLGVVLGFLIRAQARSAVAQRLGLVAAAALVVSTVALLGWLGPRIALARLLPPVPAAFFAPVALGALTLGLYLIWVPRRIRRLRDAVP